MTHEEFREIHETWMELKTIFDEIDSLNRESAEIPGYDAYAAPSASAR